MKFDKSKVYTALTADELRAGDKVIVANNIGQLIDKVERDYPVLEINGHANGYKERRFLVNDGFSYALAYLVERKENCTNCRLCNRSIKDDATKVCENYEPQDVPPVNCETCSKADTDRCPVPNPPKKTGCCHWEPKPARVCENCRNLECHGKDNNWCEVRELKLSDKAIKKNTCGYFKLVKAEKHYRPFKDTDELIKVWCEYKCPAHNHRERGLTMPFIWVRRKEANSKGQLITEFGDKLHVSMGKEGYNMTDLFVYFTFLNGTPCGVEA